MRSAGGSLRGSDIQYKLSFSANYDYRHCITQKKMLFYYLSFIGGIDYASVLCELR